MVGRTPLLILLTTGLLAVPAGGAAAQADAPAHPPIRAIPGITADDPFPGGCVDCHVYRPDEELDVRISALMARWYVAVEPALLERVRGVAGKAGVQLRGRHPEVPASLKDIPDGCMRCHRRGSEEAPPFGALVHALHLVGGESNVFLTTFQGECTYCHKLDAATGAWSLASGPEPERPDR